MPYTFADQEITEITGLKDLAEAGFIEWGDVYERVADILSQRLDADGIPQANEKSVDAARLWFQGAALVNRGESAFSTLIREYTRRQLQLHFGESEGNVIANNLMQDASDDVAINVIVTDILASGVLPSIGQLAERDATAIGLKLFDQDGQDSAFTDNAAWSGTPLFSLFGQDETDRLLGNDSSGFNTLEDFRNVLFAIDAFSYAAEQADNSPLQSIFDGTLSVGIDAFAPKIDGGASLWSLISAGWQGAWSDNWDPLLRIIVGGSSAESAITFGIQHNRYLLVDQLAALFNISVPVTDANNFLTNAHQVFNQIEANDRLNIEFKLTGSGIAALAQGNTDEARGYRYALINLLPFAVTSNLAETAAMDALYNDVYSSQFREDRALMLGAVLERNVNDATHPSLINGQQIYFYDWFNNQEAFAGQVEFGGGINPNDVTNILFGDDAANANSSLEGGNKDDRIYGLGGNDELRGRGGNDYLEGGSGQDTYVFDSSLTGGFGVDTIIDCGGYCFPVFFSEQLKAMNDRSVSVLLHSV